MKRALFGGACTIALWGCATFDNIENGMAALVGQNESELLDVLGYPDSQVEIAGEKIYRYSRAVNGSYQTTSYTSTPVQNPYTGITTYQMNSDTVTTPYHYECTLEFKVENQVIVSYRFEGNLGGCYYYANVLQDVPEKYRAR